jgi:hypothetical protein
VLWGLLRGVLCVEVSAGWRGLRQGFDSARACLRGVQLWRCNERCSESEVLSAGVLRDL